MEKTLTLEELRFIFREGCLQGADGLGNGSNYSDKAFDEAIRDMLMDRKTPREWVCDAEIKAFKASLKG